VVLPDEETETFDFFDKPSPLLDSVSTCDFGVEDRRRGCDTFVGSDIGFTWNLYPINISSSTT
jgi:hypothetical protein